MGAVLVADDDRDIRDLVEMYLTRLGHEVTAVADRQEAWELLNRRRFDLTILDRMMPRLDGLSVLSLCRRHADLHASRIVLLSAKALADEVQEGYDAGADRYITKPFALSELTRLVSDLVLA